MMKILSLIPSLRGGAEAIQIKTLFCLDCRASLAMTIIFLLLFLSLPAMAQPIESEPLGPAPYTLKNETDPMALGSVPTSDAPMTTSPSDYAPMPIIPPEPTFIEPAPAPTTQVEPVETYQNNAVSGMPPEDLAKFEKRQFCTLKISFGSYASGTDRKTGDAIKSYLDANTDKLTYSTKNWGKEGEYDYCVKVTDHKNKAEVYKAIKKIIPPLNKKSGPVRMTGDGFSSVNDNIIAPRN